MKSYYSYSLRLVLMASDCIVANGAFLASILFFHPHWRVNDPEYYINRMVVFNITWLLASGITQLYAHNTLKRIETILRKTFRTLVMHALLFMFYLLSVKTDIEIKVFFPVCYFILTTLFIISRFFLTYVTEFLLKNTKYQKRIAIVGYNDAGIRLAEYFNENRSGYSFAGFFDNQAVSYEVNAEGRIIASIDNCINYAVANNIEEIYSTLMPQHHGELVKLVETADQHCVRVKFVPDFKQMFNSSYFIEYLDTLPVISLRSEPLQVQDNRMKKRLFDVCLSVGVMVFILSWLVPLLGLIIKLESRGPVFFRQLRSGKNNKPFYCYKFRSMTVNHLSDSLQASRNDARITKVGAFLRKTSLDELPQFLNVLRGEMSLVGPRPHMLRHTEQYSVIISKYMVRQFLKPGITGWAQVNGYRGETNKAGLMEKRVEHDIWYMENWSLMLEIKIIFMTIINVLKGEEKAY